MLSALRRVDDVVGQLVTGLHHRGLYDDVNLILLADHGQSVCVCVCVCVCACVCVCVGAHGRAKWSNIGTTPVACGKPLEAQLIRCGPFQLLFLVHKLLKKTRCARSGMFVVGKIF